MSASDVESAAYLLSWINLAKIIGAFLVAIGVAAEFAGEFISRPYERTVEDARRLELAKLSADAEAAKKEIATANVAAAEANERAARLEKEAEQARSAIAAADARAKEADLKIAQIRQMRQLDPEKVRTVLADKPGLIVEVFYIESSSDGLFLSLNQRCAQRTQSRMEDSKSRSNYAPSRAFNVSFGKRYFIRYYYSI
jgi:hypothetical protein